MFKIIFLLLIFSFSQFSYAQVKRIWSTSDQEIVAREFLLRENIFFFPNHMTIDLYFVDKMGNVRIHSVSQYGSLIIGVAANKDSFYCAIRRDADDLLLIFPVKNTNEVIMRTYRYIDNVLTFINQQKEETDIMVLYFKSPWLNKKIKNPVGKATRSLVTNRRLFLISWYDDWGMGDHVRITYYDSSDVPQGSVDFIEGHVLFDDVVRYTYTGGADIWNDQILLVYPLPGKDIKIVRFDAIDGEIQSREYILPYSFKAIEKINVGVDVIFWGNWGYITVADTNITKIFRFRLDDYNFVIEDTIGTIISPQAPMSYPRIKMYDGVIYVLANGIYYFLPTDVKKEPEIPTKFALYQNYPNPFNPSTTISYDLPVRSRVKLVIYNLLGQEVATLVNGEQEPGRYNVKFDASGLPSGVYFYTLQTPYFTKTNKMVLVK
jgi:hypothetical protein